MQVMDRTITGSELVALFRSWANAGAAVDPVFARTLALCLDHGWLYKEMRWAVRHSDGQFLEQSLGPQGPFYAALSELGCVASRTNWC
jgi:hypothetical protein